MVATFSQPMTTRRLVRLFSTLALLVVTLFPSSLPSRAANRFQTADGLAAPPRSITSASYPATPFHYSSLGAFTAPGGTTTFDATSLTCGTAGAAQNVGGLAVCVFDSLSVPAGATITGSGTRPLGILVRNSVVISGTLSSMAGAETTGIGGNAVPYNSGGGGGGFGGAGGNGGLGNSVPYLCPSAAGSPGAGGVAYGNDTSVLSGGSPGGSNPSGSGGAGGGALFLYSGGPLTIASSGVIQANGNNSGTNGTPGGGSGGGITLVSQSFTNNGLIQANGSPGANGNPVCYGGGGGGGGGRIFISSPALLQAGTYTANGGMGGTGIGPGIAGSAGQTILDSSGYRYRIANPFLSKTVQFSGLDKPLHYTVVARNNSSGNASSTQLTDYLPPELGSVTWACVAQGAACPSAGGSGNLNLILDLPPSSVMTFTITATLQTITPTLVNTAHIDPDWNVWDTSPSDNTAEASLSLLFLPVLER